jgi:hypothetical protein
MRKELRRLQNKESREGNVVTYRREAEPLTDPQEEVNQEELHVLVAKALVDKTKMQGQLQHNYAMMELSRMRGVEEGKQEERTSNILDVMLRKNKKSK